MSIRWKNNNMTEDEYARRRELIRQIWAYADAHIDRVNDALSQLRDPFDPFGEEDGGKKMRFVG